MSGSVGLILDLTKDALSGRKPDTRLYVRREPEELEEQVDDPREYERKAVYPTTKKGPE